MYSPGDSKCVGAGDASGESDASDLSESRPRTCLEEEGGRGGVVLETEEGAEHVEEDVVLRRLLDEWRERERSKKESKGRAKGARDAAKRGERGGVCCGECMAYGSPKLLP